MGRTVVVNASGRTTVVESTHTRTLVVDAVRTRTVVVGVQGPPGRPGEGAAETFVHVQDAASAEWVIPHGLGRWPSVTVVDSAGDIVWGQPRYTSNNEIRIEFSAPFSGRAYLN